MSVRKILFLALSLALLSLLAVAYYDFQSNYTVTQVSVSKSKGFGGVNPDFFAVFEDKPAIKLFQRGLSEASRLPGIVDIGPGDYDLEVVYLSGRMEGFHLWPGEPGRKSGLMKVTNTHCLCSIPEDITDQLLDLLKP